MRPWLTWCRTCSMVLSVVLLLTWLPVAAADLQGERLAPDNIIVAGATIAITFAPGHLQLTRAQVVDWISDSARAVAHYYARFPVPSLQVEVIPVAGKRVGFGTTFGSHRPRIKVWLGQAAGERALQQDWVMTHEMVHLAFPRVPEAHHWIEEGLATYVEPLARLGTGQLSAETVVLDLVKGLPHGLPAPGDRGLDHTPTWGRTYWGGALFCLLADLEIRQRTENRRGLQDALRAIVTAGGTMQVSWPLTRALEVADQATGVPVLTELYERMKATPVEINLAELWQGLGVELQDGTVRFHDTAPLAAARRAIIAAAAGVRQCDRSSPCRGQSVNVSIGPSGDSRSARFLAGGRLSGRGSACDHGE